MNDAQLSRYSRHVLLPDIDFAGQERLLKQRVLIVGLGGLGSPAAIYLAASGVGTLVLADADHVELSNLQRQIIHRTQDVGRPKVESAAEMLQALNPDTQVEQLPLRLDGQNLDAVVARVDLVVDGSDNFATRYAVNQACWRALKPLVSGAVIRWDGQITVFDPRRQAQSPCYQCLYPEGPTNDLDEDTCRSAGVLAPIAGAVGALLAAEAIKVMLGVGVSLVGRLLLLGGNDMTCRTLDVRKDPACPVCGPVAKKQGA